MEKEVLVVQRDRETVIVVLEDGKPAEIHWEPESDAGVVGNVYAGVVADVLPGMQAAFVRIGLEKNGYLAEDDMEPGPGRIGDRLRPGQDLLVQVFKAPLGDKGARLTTRISLPGRYLVLRPGSGEIRVSGRIRSPEERERLERLVGDCAAPGDGLVVRTAAAGAGRAEIRADCQELSSVWDGIRDAYERERGKPALLRGEIGFVESVFRDAIRGTPCRVLTVGPSVRERIRKWLPLGLQIRELSDQEAAPYDLEGIIRRALRRRVWLPGGGYLVIDQAEALCVIDVNSGKYTGRGGLGETALAINRLAARETARQIRLRNVGGAILVDFIDMQSDGDRARILREMEEMVREDPVRVQVHGFTRLGLLEMTRRRSKRSLSGVAERTCPVCGGKGTVLEDRRLLSFLAARLRQSAGERGPGACTVRVHPLLAHRLRTTLAGALEEMARPLGLSVRVEEDPEQAADGLRVERPGGTPAGPESGAAEV